MDKELIITIALVVLIVISVVQAFELSNLKEKVTTGAISGAVPNSNDNVEDIPASNSQPQMVGGC